MQRNDTQKGALIMGDMADDLIDQMVFDVMNEQEYDDPFSGNFKVKTVVMAETEKAILVQWKEGTEKWLPKSQIKYDEGKQRDSEIKMTISDWLWFKVNPHQQVQVQDR